MDVVRTSLHPGVPWGQKDLSGLVVPARLEWPSGSAAVEEELPTIVTCTPLHFSEWLQSKVVRNTPINIWHRGRIQISVVESTLKQRLHYSCVDRGLMFQLKGMNSQKGKRELANSFGFLVMCCFSWFLLRAVIWGFWGLCKVPLC